MTTDRHEIWTVLDGLQMDARALTAKIVELRARVAGLDLPKPSTVKCPHPACGVECKGPRTLAEHLHVTHGAPVPAHLAAAEQLIEGHLQEHLEVVGRARVSPSPGSTT